MINPTAEDVLACISHAFETTIQPALAGRPEASTAQTIGHLLRHVRVRLAREGPLLAAENERLVLLNTDVAKYLGTDLAQQAKSSVNGQYYTLSDLARETASLRETLYLQLRQLQKLAPSHGKDENYIRIRERVREEIARQLQDEANLIRDGFEGYGPRR